MSNYSTIIVCLPRESDQDYDRLAVEIADACNLNLLSVSPTKSQLTTEGPYPGHEMVFVYSSKWFLPPSYQPDSDELDLFKVLARLDWESPHEVEVFWKDEERDNYDVWRLPSQPPPPSYDPKP